MITSIRMRFKNQRVIPICSTILGILFIIAIVA
ncbi:nickel ABC transporter permease subunit NikC, partial [Priestia megaterium]